jgi:hypothetical protein
MGEGPAHLRSIRQPEHALGHQVVSKDAAAQGGVRGARQLVQEREAGRCPLLELLLRSRVDMREQL